jgi:hypothetical protein
LRGDGTWKRLEKVADGTATGTWTNTTKPGSGGGTKLAPDKVHTMDQWNAATVEQRRKWLKASGGKDGKTPADPAVKAQKRFSYAYAKLGQVAFLAWVRMGGNLVDTSAVKYYAHSAT